MRSAPVPRVDLTESVETPENVVLTYQLAGPALRLGAYVVDLLISVVVYVFCLMIVFAAAMAGRVGLGAGVALILVFFVFWFYFALTEWFFRGRTPGKMAFRLRVIQDGGYPITIWSAVLRNLVRVVDAMPTAVGAAFPVYGVGLLSAFATGNFRTLGDLAARTMVIEENPVRLPREPVILERIQPLNRSEIGGFSPSARTLSLIEEFLGRRYVLTYRRGHEMAQMLAKVLANRLNYQGDPEVVTRYPMAFLASIYATFHKTLDDDKDTAGLMRGPDARTGQRRTSQPTQTSANGDRA